MRRVAGGKFYWPWGFGSGKKEYLWRLNNPPSLMRYRRLYLIIYIVSLAGCLHAQQQTSVFNFLTLPASSHAVALGGRNISVVDDDASLAFQNPALLANVSNNAMNVNFMTYMRGTKAGSASFTRLQGERGTWGVNAQFVGYGSMAETDVEGAEMGQMKPLDMCLSGLYTYNLSDRWAGGVAGKFIYSKYGSYSSVGLAVDLGLNYYDEEHNFSLSAVAANLGGQVKAFGDDHERLPFNLQVGFTKGIAHAPIRISLAVTDLTRWRSRDFYFPDKPSSGGRIFMSHFNIGVEVVPSKTFYIGAGFNFRRAYEMKAAGGSHAAGLTCGAGLNIKHFKIGLAYAKYHVSAPSLALSVGYHL